MRILNRRKTVGRIAIKKSRFFCFRLIDIGARGFREKYKKRIGMIPNPKRFQARRLSWKVLSEKQEC